MYARDRRVGIAVGAVELRLEDDLVLRDHFVEPCEQRAEVEVKAEQRTEVDQLEKVADARGEAVELDLDLVVGVERVEICRIFVGLLEDFFVADRAGDPRVVEEDTEHDAYDAFKTAQHVETAEVDAVKQLVEQARDLGDDRRYVVGLHVGDLVKPVLSADVDEHPVVGDVDAERGVVVKLLDLEHEVVGLELACAAVLQHVRVQRDQTAFDIRFESDGVHAFFPADRLGIAGEDLLERVIRRLRGGELLNFVGVELFRPAGEYRPVPAYGEREGHLSAAGKGVRFVLIPALEDIALSCRDELVVGHIPRTGDHHQLSRRHRVAAHRVERDGIARLFPLRIERGIARHRVGEGDRLSARRVEVPTREGRTRRVCAGIKVACVDLGIESKSGDHRTLTAFQRDDRRIGVDRLPRGVECGSRRSDRIGIGDRLRKSAVEVPPHECLTGRRCARIGRLRQGRVRLRYRGVSLTISARKRHRITGNVVGVEGQRLDARKFIRKLDRLCERFVEVPSREVLPRDVFRVGRFGDDRRTFVALIHLRSGRPVRIVEVDRNAGGLNTACKNQCDRYQDDEDGYRQFGFSHNCSPERQYIYAHASAPRMRISFHNL